MATIYTVSSSDELYEALAKAQGGDEIRLASGDYGDLTLNSKSGFDITFDAPVKITSLDADAPAIISTMYLDGVSNLSFDSINFDYKIQEGDPLWASPFQIKNSSKITIQNSVFDGEVASGVSAEDDGFGYGRALMTSNNDQINILNNKFYDFHRAFGASESTNILVKGNEIYNLRSDGLNFSEVQNVLIEDNYIHDFNTNESSGDHADMIQFWTTNTTAPSTNIVIRNNTLDIGEGDQTQAILMRNEMVELGGAGDGMFYQNVLIEDNVILNAHIHGITIGETDGLVIKQNTLLSVDPDDPRYFGAPSINLSEASTSVSVTQNAVSLIQGAGSSAIVSGNAFIQNHDPSGIGHYGDQFISSSMGGLAADYVVVPGSMVDQLDAGSIQHSLDMVPGELSPQFSVYSKDGASQTLIFDAGNTFDEGGKVDATDAKFIWDFGDGTVMEGVSGTHTYAEPGRYNVTLTIEPYDGSEGSSITSEVGIVGRGLLSFDSNTGAFEKLGYGDANMLDGSADASVFIGSKAALDLGGTGVRLEVRKEDISKFFGSDGFEMSMTLQADHPGSSWGEIARVHGNIIMSVTDEGKLKVALITDTGSAVELITQNTVVNDGTAHDISVRFDGKTDNFEIVVDGVQAAVSAIEGNVQPMAYWGLTFGEPWGGQNFDGKLTAFTLYANVSDYSHYTGQIDDFVPVTAEDQIVEQPLPPVTEEPASEPENSNPEDEVGLPILDDYVLDFTGLTGGMLKSGATVQSMPSDGTELFVDLDGGREHLSLGRLTEFERAEQLSFSIDFRKDNASDGDMRLVWNHTHVAVTVNENGLEIGVGEMDTAFHKTLIELNNLGINDTDRHSLRVVVDDDTDQMQVILDGTVVYSETGERDIEVSGSSAGQWGWTIGSAWGHQFEGEIYDFRIEADAEFISPQDNDFVSI